MKNTSRRLPLSLLLIFIMFTLLVAFRPTAAHAATRQTDVTTPSSGNILVNVPGEFATADVAAILNLVNSYRREACQNGYPNPGNPSVPLSMSDYSKVQWSGDLEWIAQTRAAEGSVFQSHDRPNGASCFDIQHNGVYSSSETLAWNYGSLLGGIQQWYGEKADWVNQRSGAVTGHYTAMIDPYLKYIGIGCFTSTSGDWSCVAGAYSYSSSLSTAQQGLYGRHTQIMEVPSSSLSSLTIQGASTVAIGKTAAYSSLQTVSFPGIMGGTLLTPVQPSGTATWSSSNSSVATISSGGSLTAHAPGNVSITLSYSGGASASKTVTVTKPAKGTAISFGGARFKITNASGEVAYTKGPSGAKTVTIPGEIRYSGFTYKVTSIANNAFKNSKVLKTATIGPNVQVIGQKAFYNCKKLKTLTIQSMKLKASKVGSKAFAKTGIKKVKVPKGKKKAYKKWLAKKGVSKKAKIK